MMLYDIRFHSLKLIIIAISILLHIGNCDDISTERRLQFEGMFEHGGIQNRRERDRESVGVKARRGKKSLSAQLVRSQFMKKQVNEILANGDRYHQWWTGPDLDITKIFSPASWAAPHRRDSRYAIFTAAVARGTDDSTCSSPNDYRLFLGSARRAGISADIVIAIENNYSEEVKAILREYKATVYEIPKEICSPAAGSADNTCGSADERVPASVFRYYFYEKWAALYNESTSILLADFKDVLFQSDPFVFHRNEWSEYQLTVFQEFHPNMVLGRSPRHKELFLSCYDQETLLMHGHKIVISSGTIMGNRNSILIFSHAMTMQLQDAPGRVVETRCQAPGIDQSFTNFLVYTNKLRQVMRIKIYPQGEGPVNCLGGNMIAGNVAWSPRLISGSLKEFWKVLDFENYVLNWSGERSPVVHQINHFIDELKQLAKSNQSISSRIKDEKDLAWQALSASRCLWGC